MTLWDACVWSLVRSLLHAALGVVVAIPLGRQLKAAQGHSRFWWSLAVLVPFFVPSLVVGFRYRDASLALIHHPRWNECLYALIVLVRVVPVGAILVSILPSPALSREAIHVHRLRFRGPSSTRMVRNLAWSARRWSLHAVVAGFGMFLLSFQESELAALMMVTSWTEWLFTQQAGGLPLSDSLRFATRPMLAQALVWVPCLWFVVRHHRQRASHSSAQFSPARFTVCGLVMFLVVSHLLVVIVPGVRLLRDAVGGVQVLVENPSLGTEIISGLIMAATTGTIAYHIAGWGLGWSGRSSKHQVLSVVVLWGAACGLLGNLIVGLGFANLFQQPGVQWAYDTPVPWGLALMVLLLPLAVVVRATVAAWQQGAGSHVARLLEVSQDPTQRRSGRWLGWMQAGRGEFWGGVMVCWLAYTDLMTASLLAPPRMTPAPMRLYNFLHYGRNNGLAAMMLVTMLAPAVVIGVAYAVRRRLVTVR